MTNAYMQEFIVANERCIYLQAFIFANDSYRYIYSYLQIAVQICTDPCKFGNQGPTSSLWARVPQLNGFVKLLFSNTPGALGYKFRLTSQSQSFSAPYISVCVCGVFWCPHIMYVSYVCLPLVFERFLRQKRYEDNIWLGQGMLRMAKRRILFYSWEVFFSSQNWLQSLNFLWLWKTT